MKLSIKIQGGLGNQLFQWAQGVFLETLGAQVFYDRTFYKNKNGTKIIPHRNFCLDEILKSPLPQINGEDISAIMGYWQEDNNIEKIKDNIIQSVKKCPIKTIEDSCSIHVRRGDYISLKDIYHNLDKDYYMKGIERINPSGPIFIFSDDISWCKKNIDLKNAIYSEDNSEIDDFQLMRSCNHNIISNSTFSWWAAWLNCNQNKKIIQPKLWYKKKSQGKLFNPNWMVEQ